MHDRGTRAGTAAPAAGLGIGSGSGRERGLECGRNLIANLKSAPAMLRALRPPTATATPTATESVQRFFFGTTVICPLCSRTAYSTSSTVLTPKAARAA